MPTIKTNYTAVSRPTTNWGLEERHTFGREVGTTNRIRLGDHVRFGGLVKVEYKFISRTDYTYV